jgi:hypothetical protein
MCNRGTHVETLEGRALLAAVFPTVYEQYMVELYNFARMNPAAVEAEYGFGLNEGPPAFPISYDPKQPLAINPFLVDSARSYAQYMIDNGVFSRGNAWRRRVTRSAPLPVSTRTRCDAAAATT